MRILAYMPARNEFGRYLDACLSWLTPIVDGVFVYDDASTDQTAGLAMYRGATVVHRPANVPRFIEHEGRFRQAAWAAFECAFEPNVGDWILAIDADEFLVADIDERDALEMSAHAAQLQDGTAVLLPVPEVFEGSVGDDGRIRDLRVRTDGQWARIAGTRFFGYREGGRFRDRAMGCGAEPTYVAESRHRVVAQGGAKLLHLGYCDADDRAAKYNRYSSLVAHGHDNGHIASIMTTPVLEPWHGKTPAVWRGALERKTA